VGKKKNVEKKNVGEEEKGSLRQAERFFANAQNDRKKSGSG